LLATRRHHRQEPLGKPTARFAVRPEAALPPQHWPVENRLHWVLDVVFREDACWVRVGDGTHNLAILRPLALNLLRQEPTLRGSLATKRFRAALDDTYLRRLLAGLDGLPRDQTASTT